MKSQPLPDPSQFDGAKFAARHGLEHDEFHARKGRLFYPDRLPDNAAMFGPPGSAAADAPSVKNPRPIAAIRAVMDGRATIEQLTDAVSHLLELKGI